MRENQFVNLTSYSVEIWRANAHEAPMKVKTLRRGERSRLADYASEVL